MENLPMRRHYENKQSNNGFTLVELIVVLVILAILAAILVPALLGWIDRSKTSQTLLDANALMKAIQSETADAYAKGSLGISGSASNIDKDSHYPSIRKIMNYLEANDFGDPGDDWCYRKGVVYNGFGYGKSGYEKSESKKHFKCLISERGQIQHLTFCDGQYVADYTPDDGFSVKENTANCTKQNYNYICIGTEGEKYYKSLAPKWE